MKVEFCQGMLSLNASRLGCQDIAFKLASTLVTDLPCFTSRDRCRHLPSISCSYLSQVKSFDTASVIQDHERKHVYPRAQIEPLCCSMTRGFNLNHHSR